MVNKFLVYSIIGIIFLICLVSLIYYSAEKGVTFDTFENIIYAGLDFKYLTETLSNPPATNEAIENPTTEKFLVKNDNIPIEEDTIESDKKHWDHMPLSFTFINPEDCGGFQTRRILRAFNEIQNSTQDKVSFFQINASEADISIICNKKFLPSTEPGLIESGEATVHNRGKIYIKSEINFYNTAGESYNGGCRNYPDVEIHEILHVFGLPHTDAEYNIMNPVGSYCPTKINQDIIDYLMDIYG